MAAVLVLRCATCRLWMVNSKARRRWPWLAARYATHAGRGLCGRCWYHAKCAGDLVDFERRTVKRDELLDEWTLLHSEGYTIPQAAPRFGMTVWALVGALERARKDGDPRAVFDQRGVHGWRNEVGA